MSESIRVSGSLRQGKRSVGLLMSAVGLACGLLASGQAGAVDVDEQYRQGLY